MDIYVKIYKKNEQPIIYITVENTKHLHQLPFSTKLATFQVKNCLFNAAKYKRENQPLYRSDAFK